MIGQVAGIQMTVLTAFSQSSYVFGLRYNNFFQMRREFKLVPVLTNLKSCDIDVNPSTFQLELPSDHTNHHVFFNDHLFLPYSSHVCVLFNQSFVQTTSRYFRILPT